MTLAAGLMLVSAVSHAVIGTLMKAQEDKLVFRGILGTVCALFVLPFTFVVAVPPAPVWVWLGIGAGLHFTYQLSQVAAFNRGDMGLVYPVMRGVAPLLVGLFAFVILQERLSPEAIAGLAIVAASLIGFGWQSSSSSVKSGSKSWRAAVGFAVLCGALTAAYTVIDAKGIRVSGDRLSYLVWFFLIDGIGIAIIAAVFRGKKLKAALRPQMRSGIVAGGLSLVSYGAALIALSLGPAAPLAAIRETSVIFGAIFAALVLKEKFGARRIALSCALAFGLTLMQMG